MVASRSGTDGAGGAFCRVTTRGPNSWLGHGFGRGLGPLPARLLCGGVLPFHFGIFAALGLSALGLPTAQQSLALGILAIALVPAFGLKLSAATAAMAEARPRLASTGLATCSWGRLGGAHGRSRLPGVSPRKRSISSSCDFFNRMETVSLPREAEEDEEQDGFGKAPPKETDA